MAIPNNPIQCQIQTFKYKCLHPGQETTVKCVWSVGDTSAHCTPQITGTEEVRDVLCEDCIALSLPDIGGADMVDESGVIRARSDFEKKKSHLRIPKKPQALRSLVQTKSKTRRKISRSREVRFKHTRNKVERKVARCEGARYKDTKLSKLKMYRKAGQDAGGYVTSMKRSRTSRKKLIVGERMEIDDGGSGEVAGVSGLSNVLSKLSFE